VEVRDVRITASGIFMLGFIAGIIYVNIFAKAYVVSTGVFSDYFLEQCSVNQIDTREYMFYIIKIRVLPLLILGIAANTKYKKFAASLFLVWTGFSGGLIFTTAVLKMGIKGIGLCVVGVLPQFVCYVVLYTVLLLYLFTYPNTRWNSTKTMSITIFMMLGIISECYINPVILHVFMNMI